MEVPESVSAGADTPDISGPESSPSSGDAGLSEDAIFDKYAPSEEAPAETQAQSAVDAKPTTDKPEAQEAKEGEEEAIEPLLQEPEPENLKKAFKSLQKWHPDVAKQLRNSWFENRAYRETFTVPEARELRQLFPSVQDAKAAREATADLMAVDELLVSSPETLLQHIQSRAPNEFVKLALAMPQVLYNVDPQTYRQNVSEPAVRNYHNFWSSQAQQTNDADLQTALEIIQDRESRMFGGQGQRGQAQQQHQQADPRLLQRLQQLEAEKAQVQAGATNSFRDAVDNDFNSAVKGEVEKLIERSGADLSDAAKEEITERVLSDAKDNLLSDQILQRRLNWALSKGRHDATQRSELLNLLVANAKRFIPSSASSHLGWMTKEILKANAGSMEKAARTQTSRNVSGATPGSGGKQPLSKDQIAKMSEDEIITAAANGLL